MMRILLATLLAFVTSAAMAQFPLPGGGDGEPVEIEAVDALEWLQEQQLYIARGNARLRQGDVVISADVLTARYREDEETGGTFIFEAIAEGSVVIESPDGRAEADRVVYDRDQELITMTGEALRLENGDDVVTAEDSMEYFVTERLGVATGDAEMTRDTDHVRADVLRVEFVEDEAGELSVSRATAEGDVLITTPEDVAASDEAVYDLTTNLATLIGNVRLTRGDNHLSGSRAEVDLETGISRLLAAGSGPVRALLVPEDADELENSNE